MPLPNRKLTCDRVGLSSLKFEDGVRLKLTGVTSCRSPRLDLRSSGRSKWVARNSLEEELPTGEVKQPRTPVNAILRQAIGVYLKLVSDSVGRAEVLLQSRSRDLLAGRVEGLQITAEDIVYKGLEISLAELTADCITLDLSELATGRILQKPFGVKAVLRMTQQDLTASLESAKLRGFLRGLLRDEWSFRAVSAEIKDERILLSSADSLTSLTLRPFLSADGHELFLEGALVSLVEPGSVTTVQERLDTVIGPTSTDQNRRVVLLKECFPLGKTSLSKLCLSDGTLECRGVFWVTPAVEEEV